MRVTLKVNRNPIPTRRQLKALQSIYRDAGKKDSEALKKKKKLSHEFFKGAAREEESGHGLKEEAFEHRLSPEQKQRFEDFEKACEFNPSQQLLWDGIFGHRHHTVVLQGPPGTGKTFTVSSIAMGLALLSGKTALCAPTNIATKACLEAVVAQYEKLAERHPDIVKELHIVYVPTTSTTRDSFKDVGEDELLDRVNNLTFETGTSERDPCKKYTLHTHVVASFKRRANGRSTEAEEAQGWLKAYELLRRGGQLDRKSMRVYLDMALAESAAVFKGARTKLVICTSNSADQLVEYGYKVYAVVVDESAFATEQDTCVPLSLNIRSRGHNEFARNHGLPLFERVYGRPNIPLFRLRVNYRIHPDIAELPGMLSYEFLDSADKTKVESDTYKFWHNFYQSANGDTWRLNEDAAEYDGVEDPNDRVRWIDLGELCVGAAKPGGTSLRNFANINACVDLVTALLGHKAPADIKPLDSKKITVITP
jgi:hypothetical protein